MTFVPETEVRESVARLFSRIERQLRELLPGAEIEHVGSTAIPGCLTKGDLDIQVRVSTEAYAAARRKLAELYEINEGGFAADDATSFEDYSTEPPHGVHLTVINGSCDIQWRFRDAIRASGELRQEYDEFKRRFEGRPAKAYRDAKCDFVLRVEESAAYPRADRDG